MSILQGYTEATVILNELFGRKKKKEDSDSSDKHISKEDYDRIKKMYGKKDKLPKSNTIDVAAWIICDYNLSDLDKFCNESDTKKFISVAKREYQKDPIYKNKDTDTFINSLKKDSIAHIYSSSEINTDGWYCKDTNKLYFVFEDGSDLYNGKNMSMLISMVKSDLETYNIHYYEPYEG